MARFTDALNEQIAYEFGASQQYIAIAVYYDAQTLPQLAAHFYRQAVEERNHAMMMVQYLLDADEKVVIPAVEAPQVSFSDVTAPVQLALDQEKRVTGQLQQLALTARDEVDRRAARYGPEAAPGMPGGGGLSFIAGWIGLKCGSRWPIARRRRMLKAMARV